jgi:large subunit ribosomal protein L19e
LADLTLQKKLAAEILGVGVSRIKIDPSRISDVSQAVTREDVKRLINEGAILIKPEHGIAGHASRVRHKKRVKGGRRGHGKRKGSKHARMSSKEAWMGRIRKIRRYLRYLRDHGIIEKKTYRRLYMLAKGGYFTSLSSLRLYLKEHSLIKETER